MLQAITWCLGEIAGTLVRFAAYCAVLAAAIMGGWMLVTSLFEHDLGLQAPPPESPGAQVLWLDRTDAPPLRRSQD